MSESAVFAKDSCLTEFNGLPVHINRGDAWAADDPFVKARPDLFEEPTVVRRTPGAEPKIERGTRAPGERRGPGRPRKDSY